MTIKEAFEAVISEFYSGERKPYLVSCLDFGDFWGFGFSSVPLEKGGLCYGYITVFKADGRISVMNPWYEENGVELMDNAIDIPVDEVVG